MLAAPAALALFIRSPFTLSLMLTLLFIVALLVFAYMLYVLIRPEKF